MEVHKGPKNNVQTQKQGDVDAGNEPGVETDEEEGYQEDGQHGGMRRKAGMQQLVMEMVLVGQERALVLAQTVHDYADHIEQGNDEGGKGDNHIFIAATGMSGVDNGEMNNEKAQHIAQHKATGIAHEYLVAALCVAKHIVEPEGDEDSQRGKSQLGIDVLLAPDMHKTQSKEGDAAEAGSQTVDAIDEVDGVGDINHDENGDEDAQQRGQFVDAENAAQGVNPRMGNYKQRGCNDLHQELIAVADTDEVVLNAYQIEQNGTGGKKQVLIERLFRFEILQRIVHAIAQAGDKTQGDKDDRQKREASQTGNRHGVYLALIGDVEKTFFVRDEQYLGNQEHAQQGSNQETADNEPNNHVIK